MQVTLLFPGERQRWRIWCFQCFSSRGRRVPPGWKIHLLKRPPGFCWLKWGLETHPALIKWHLKPRAFQMDCKVDKGAVTDGSLPLGHLDISLFFLQLTWKNTAGWRQIKKTKKTKVSQINQSLKVATRQNLRKFIRKSAGVSLTGGYSNR